jgi:hypothetical protein
MSCYSEGGAEGMLMWAIPHNDPLIYAFLLINIDCTQQAVD